METPREKLQRYRTSHKLTQGELAELCGITPATFSRIISGVLDPGLQSAIRIQEVTGGFVAVIDWKKSELLDGKNVGPKRQRRIAETTT